MPGYAQHKEDWTKMKRNLEVGLFLAVLLLASASAFAEYTGAKPVWVKHPGNELRDAAQSACALPDGSLLVTGWFEHLYEADLNPAPASFGMRDVFWSKYDAGGQLQWVKSAGSGHCDVSGAISALPGGTFIVACSYGYGGASATFGIGEPNEVSLRHHDRYDIALVKCNPDGTLIWARRMGGPEVDMANAAAIVPNGGCYILGIHDDVIHFGEDDGVDGNETTLPVGMPAQFVAYYSTDGVFQWVKPGYYEMIEPLADSSCLVSAASRTTRFAPDGSELWNSNDIGPGSCCAFPNSNEFLYYLSEGRQLRKYRFETGSNSPTLVWQKPLACDDVYPWLRCRPDGSFVVYTRPEAKIYTFDPAGNMLGTINFYLPVYFASLVLNPTDESFYFTGTVDRDITFGEGTTNTVPIAYRGANDIVIAKFIPETSYIVDIGPEGRGVALLYPPGGHYAAGTTVTVVAAPIFSSHDEFDHWEGDFEGFTDAVVNLTVEDRDISATAVFAELPGAPPLPASTPVALLMLSLIAVGLSRSLMKPLNK
jgi:hypothetical protein